MNFRLRFCRLVGSAHVSMKKTNLRAYRKHLASNTTTNLFTRFVHKFQILLSNYSANQNESWFCFILSQDSCIVPIAHTDWKWIFGGNNHFQCCPTIIWHLGVSVALIGVNLHYKIIKIPKRPHKGQKRPSQKWSLNYMLCDHNLTFYCVFGLNWCQFTPETYEKSKRPQKATKGQ